MSKTLQYLVSGRLAFQITREQITLGKGECLTVVADVEEGSSLCLMSEGKDPTVIPMGIECRAAIENEKLPEGIVKLLFVKDGTTIDAGDVTVRTVDSGGTKTILPALMSSTTERERFASMMANILARLKSAEDELDKLKNGADIIE